MRLHPPQRRSNPAFSLIELLVSIALVAILSMLIFSASKSLRSKSEASRCLSNLRNTGAATIRYFTERNGYFFPSKYWEVYASTQSPSVQGMRDYLGVDTDLKNINNVPAYQHDSIITCPTMRRLNPGIRHALHRTYSFNYYLNYKNPNSKYNGTPYGDIPLLPSGFWKMQNITEPAQMWLFTESTILNSSTYGTSISDSDALLDSLPFPHEGRQHFVFLDGHVEALSRSEVEQRAKQHTFWGRRP